MNRRTGLMLAAFALSLTGAPMTASAADADIVVRVPARVYTGVPRVKPSSPTKQYPFGLLRQDYGPYGMPGVPARLYFTARERDLR